MLRGAEIFSKRIHHRVPHTRFHRAFSLVELLVVIAIIAILAALIFPAFSRAKDRARALSCASRLKEIGLAMDMYVSDHNIYPAALGGNPLNTWADQLAPFYPLNWTNLAWHCPSYIAEGGKVIRQPPPEGGGTFHFAGSYAYNASGMLGFAANNTNLIRNSSWLGLGLLNRKVPENRVVSPSEMYAAGDSRPLRYHDRSGIEGSMKMYPWQLVPVDPSTKDAEVEPPHAGVYNLLFADGRVSFVQRRDYLLPPLAASHWNRDNQPHPEFWSPTNEWAVQN